jgi:hypothetical protein
MKVIINNCYGGFSISLDGCRWMAERGHEQAKKDVSDYEDELRVFEHYKAHGVLGDDHMRRFKTSLFDISIKYNKLPDFYSGRDFKRHDPLLVACVEALGGEHRKGASGAHACLKIVEIPDGMEYEIVEYDGMEHVAEKHRTWS